jgi:hypothetical protein
MADRKERSISISANLHKRMRVYAQRHGIAGAEVLRRALRDILGDDEAPYGSRRSDTRSAPIESSESCDTAST